MSQANGPDPLDRLRVADPVRADDVPGASLARVQAKVQEHIMADSKFDPSVRPTRGPLAKLAGVTIAGAFALALAFSNGFGLPGGGGANPTDPGSTPSVNPGGGGAVGSCLRYDVSTLPTFDVVFDGTVTAIDGDQVTFDVHTGWKGAEGSLTLTAPASDIAITGPAPEFVVGGRYLVTAAGTNINTCGFTLDYDADTAAEWAGAF